MKRPAPVGFTRKAIRYLKDPAVALWKKGAALLAAVYVVSPVDVIPDVIPVLGWLDDLGVLSVTAWYMVRQIQKHAQQVDALPRAEAPGSDPTRQS